MSSGLVSASPVPPGPMARAAWLRPLAALISFEFLLALYLYSNSLKLVFGIRPPVDETAILAALAVVVATVVVSRQGIPLRSLFPLAAFLLFLGWVVISAGWSPSRLLVREYLLHYLLFDLFPLLAASLVMAADRKRIERFLILTAVLALAIAIFGNIVYFQHGNFKQATMDWGARTYNNLGYTVAFGAVTWFALAAFSRFGSRRQLGALLAFVPCFFFVIVAASRRSFVLVAVAAVTLLLLTGVELGRRRLALSVAQIAAFFLAVLGALLIAVAYAHDLRVETIDRLLGELSKIEHDAVILGPNRIDYWKTAIRAIADAPLFGHGLAGFNMYALDIVYYGAHPHNIVLEILANFGVVGMLLFAPVLIVALGRLRLRHSDGSVDPLAVVVGVLLLSTFTVSLVGTTLADQPYLFTSIGLALLPRDGGAGRRVPAPETRESHADSPRRGVMARPTIRPLS